MKRISVLNELIIRNGLGYIEGHELRNKAEYANISDKELLNVMKIKKYSKLNLSLLELCNAAGIKIEDVTNYIEEHKEALRNNPEYFEDKTEADWVIGYANAEINQDIATLAEKVNVSIPAWKGVKRKNPSWDNLDLIQYFLHNNNHTKNILYTIKIDGKEFSLKDACKIANVTYDKVRMYHRRHKEETIEQCLCECSSVVYTNVFGELTTYTD